ncbi:Myb-like DNA-binding protein myb-1 [Paraphaeosphaeria minitans]|uniref:Myb-like DNA-binding protein myb-1 n=1 Tax=Paraphaeosphaeria minitans TaxID=565426 RepID=A0A9P6GAT1_9PLEO|nr:Myb-like DNA-binding protein myb-1 [Paraphaeosphaeria minitans]
MAMHDGQPAGATPASQPYRGATRLREKEWVAPGFFNIVAHRRGPWSQHEDRYLIELVTRNGPHNWVRISQEITTRSPKQCRERYHQNLKPSLNHEPISQEEGELIEKLVADMGKRWAEIARRLQGRSDNAVKNWWNGGQNRRKRNPERDQPSHPQAAYHYPAVAHQPHHEDDAHRLSYSSSRRTSLNPPTHSPHVLTLPQSQGFEPYAGPRPAPLQLQPYHSHASRGLGIDTPMPSPSGYSIVSADGAPSLITDTGSESRSPRGAASPLDLTLAPLVGSREERRSSCTRYLPHMGFANEDDDHTAYDYRRGSVQLPPLVGAENRTTTPFREPVSKQSYRVERRQLLTQPAHQLVHHHSLPYLAPVEQRPLPPFATLAEPNRVPLPSPRRASPSSRHLPSPFTRTAQPTETRSAPISPKDKAQAQDSRMDLRSLVM